MQPCLDNICPSALYVKICFYVRYLHQKPVISSVICFVLSCKIYYRVPCQHPLLMYHDPAEREIPVDSLQLMPDSRVD